MTVTPYNFRKPGRLNVALEQQIRSWIETACALATRRWRQDLPTPFELVLVDSETQRARPTLLSLQDEAVAHPLALRQQLTTILAWPRPLVLAVVSTLLGDALTELPENRELTAVDESLFEFFLRDMLFPSFVETWSGQIPIRPELGEKIQHPRWSKIYQPEDNLLIVNLAIKGAFGEHPWRWLIPLGQLSGSWRDNTDGEQDTANTPERLATHIQELPVELCVKLGIANLPLSQLAHLQIGDVILLDQAVNQPLSIEIEGEAKLTGWPGKLGNRQAFRIEHWKQ